MCGSTGAAHDVAGGGFFPCEAFSQESGDRNVRGEKSSARGQFFADSPAHRVPWAAGVTVGERTEINGLGRFGWIMDPAEGTPIERWQPSA